jgi:hypothetical protein
MSDEQFATPEPQHMMAPPEAVPQRAPAAPLDRTEHRLALEIIEVLAAHPKGLRRWSVMRAIRKNRDLASKDIPPKMEADVERVFRRLCAGDDARKCSAESALFFRPEEKAGEVWAAYPDRVKAWLEM